MYEQVRGRGERRDKRCIFKVGLGRLSSLQGEFSGQQSDTAFHNYSVNWCHQNNVLIDFLKMNGEKTKTALEDKQEEKVADEGRGKMRGKDRFKVDCQSSLNVSILGWVSLLVYIYECILYIQVNTHTYTYIHRYMHTQAYIRLDACIQVQQRCFRSPVLYEN